LEKQSVKLACSVLVALDRRAVCDDGKVILQDERKRKMTLIIMHDIFFIVYFLAYSKRRLDQAVL